METQANIPHDFLPNDQRIIELVERLYTEWQPVYNELMNRIIEVNHEC